MARPGLAHPRGGACGVGYRSCSLAKLGPDQTAPMTVGSGARKATTTYRPTATSGMSIATAGASTNSTNTAPAVESSAASSCQCIIASVAPPTCANMIKTAAVTQRTTRECIGSSMSVVKMMASTVEHYAQVAMARVRAGLPNRAHDLKHTFGRRLRAAGVSFRDRQTAQALLRAGHNALLGCGFAAPYRRANPRVRIARGRSSWSSCAVRSSGVPQKLLQAPKKPGLQKSTKSRTTRDIERGRQG